MYMLQQPNLELAVSVLYVIVIQTASFIIKHNPERKKLWSREEKCAQCLGLLRDAWHFEYMQSAVYTQMHQKTHNSERQIDKDTHWQLYFLSGCVWWWQDAVCITITQDWLRLSRLGCCNMYKLEVEKRFFLLSKLSRQLVLITLIWNYQLWTSHVTTLYM